MKCSDIINNVYTYLGYRNIVRDEKTDSLIEKMFKEVEELSSFKYIYAREDTYPDFIKNNPVYMSFLKGCSSCYFVLMTLGKRIDDRCRYYSVADPVRMCVFDAVSSAYLEYLSDEFEKETFKEKHTYRFCPGYQGTSTSDLKEIFSYIDASKAGVSLLSSYLMVPLKSMCGIIGNGCEKKKVCGNCVLKDKCMYLKEGRTCY